MIWNFLKFKKNGIDLQSKEFRMFIKIDLK